MDRYPIDCQGNLMTVLDRPPLSVGAAPLAPVSRRAAPALSPPTSAPRASAPPAPGERAPAPRQRARRDPFLDVLRAGGTLAIVGLHWLMPRTTWDGEHLAVSNALASGPGWLLTWTFMALPLMFFVAGAATFTQLARRPVPWRAFVGRRLARLVTPVAAFLGTWLLLACALPLLGVPAGAVAVAARIAPQLLWYLGVYVILLAGSHLLLVAYRRWPRGLAVGLAAGAVAVDALRFGAGVPGVEVLNLVFVWACAYVVGYAYADGRLAALSPRCLAGVAAAGVGGLILAVSLGPYPPSMVGMPGEAVSNLGPPTLCILLLTVAQVAGVLAAHGAILRLAGRPAVARAVDWIAARSMTLYLWHLTAMFGVVGVVVVLAGVVVPEPWTAAWWAAQPVCFAAYAAVLALLVRLFARVELRGPGVAGPLRAERGTG